MADHDASCGAPPDKWTRQSTEIGPTSSEVGAELAPAPHDDQGLDRMVFFSDAVIAIALTLLALDLPIPSVLKSDHPTNGALWANFRANWSDYYFPFLLSFIVIANFWLVHHRLFRHVARLGAGMLQSNLVFLLTIVLLPFVTRVLGVDGDYAIGPVLYAIVVAGASFSVGSMGVLARRQHVLRRDESPERVRAIITGAYAAGTIFLISLPIAFWRPTYAPYSWLVLALLLRFGRELVSKARATPKLGI